MFKQIPFNDLSLKLLIFCTPKLTHGKIGYLTDFILFSIPLYKIKFIVSSSPIYLRLLLIFLFLVLVKSSIGTISWI